MRIPLHTTNLVLAEVHRLALFRAGVPAGWRALDRIAHLRLARARFMALGAPVYARRTEALAATAGIRLEGP